MEIVSKELNDVLSVIIKMRENVFIILTTKPHAYNTEAIKMADIFKFVFLRVNHCIWIQISLKFVPNGPVDNQIALV